MADGYFRESFRPWPPTAYYAVFSGDDNFNPAYKSVVFKVDVDSETLIKTNLTINVSDIKKGETAKVEGQLTDLNGDGI